MLDARSQGPLGHIQGSENTVTHSSKNASPWAYNFTSLSLFSHPPNGDNNSIYIIGTLWVLKVKSRLLSVWYSPWHLISQYILPIFIDKSFSGIRQRPFIHSPNTWSSTFEALSWILRWIRQVLSFMKFIFQWEEADVHFNCSKQLQRKSTWRFESKHHGDGDLIVYIIRVSKGLTEEGLILVRTWWMKMSCLAKV